MSYTARGRQESVYGTPIDSFATAKDLKTSVVKYVLNGIDATATGTGTVCTTDGGTSLFYPTKATFILAAVTTHTSVASISLGTNSTTFNNVLANTAATGCSAAGGYQATAITAPTSGRIAASTAIIYKINTAATAGGAETYSIILEGFYEDLTGSTSLQAG